MCFKVMLDLPKPFMRSNGKLMVVVRDAWWDMSLIVSTSINPEAHMSYTFTGGAKKFQTLVQSVDALPQSPLSSCKSDRYLGY